MEPIGIVLETVLVWFSMVLLLIFSYYMYMTTSEDKPLRPLLMLATAAITLVGDFSRVVAVYGCGVTKHLLRYPWLSKAERENTKVKKGTKELSLRRIMETVKGTRESPGSLIYDSLVFVFAVLICADPRMLFLDKLSIFFLIAIVFYSTLPNFKRNVKILMEGNLRRSLASRSGVHRGDQEADPRDRRGAAGRVHQGLGRRGVLLRGERAHLGGSSDSRRRKTSRRTR